MSRIENSGGPDGCCFSLNDQVMIIGRKVEVTIVGPRSIHPVQAKLLQVLFDESAVEALTTTSDMCTGSNCLQSGIIGEFNCGKCDRRIRSTQI